MNLEYFQLIDRITAVDSAERTIAVDANVPLTSTIFEGHFPGHPLMPGVLLIEAMAQTSGWLLIAMMRFERMPFLAAVKEAKMRNFVRPGEKLAISARLIHEGSGFAMTSAEIKVEGKKTCSATLTFSHVPFPNEEIRKHMEIEAQRVGLPQSATAHD
jgi:3-hydroxyacyl-[acyl-carrier-protein] dehydratase